MKDQHKKIKGYRELSQNEIDLMNESKVLAEQCGEFIKKLNDMQEAKGIIDEERPDQRWIAIGQSHLQQGFMALVRSVAKPTTF